MATKLEKPLRREVSIELSWQDLVSGEAALATALRASITGDVQLEPSKKNIRGRKKKW